jgi:hypothetical protein
MDGCMLVSMIEPIRICPPPQKKPRNILGRERSLTVVAQPKIPQLYFPIQRAIPYLRSLTVRKGLKGVVEGILMSIDQMSLPKIAEM